MRWTQSIVSVCSVLSVQYQTQSRVVEWAGSVLTRMLAKVHLIEEVVGSTPALALSDNYWASCSHTHTHVPVSPSSIIWYGSRGGDALRLGR